jgi:hypothetical protein
MRVKNQQKVMVIDKSHPIFLFYALFRAFRLLVLGVILYVVVKHGVMKLILHSEVQEVAKTVTKSKEETKAREEAVKEGLKKDDVIGEQKSNYVSMVASEGNVVSHEIKHIVEFGGNMSLFHFPEDRGVFDVGLLLCPYYPHREMRAWYSGLEDCQDSMVLVQLRVGNQIDAPVIFEHVLKNGEVTPIVWRNLITYNTYNIQLWFYPKNEIGWNRLNYNRKNPKPKGEISNKCDYVNIHGSFGFIYRGDVDYLLKKKYKQAY